MATYAGADKRLEYLFENGGGGGTGGAYYHADWIADSSSAEDTQLTDIVNIYNAGKYLAVITMPAISSGSDTFHVKLSGFSDITPQVFTGLGSTAFIFELTSNDVPRTIDVRSFLSTSATWTNKYKGGLDIFCLSSVGGSGDPTTFAGLTDVDFSNLQNGQIPKYNSTTLKWENGKANISEAGDVNLNNVQNDQILVYDSVLQKWKNANQSGGGGGTTVIANPSGAATGGDLLKLQVGNVIYSIPSGGGGGINYSTEEQNTGIKWLDNSDIYQKSWDFGNSPLSIPTQAWTNTSISKSGIGTIVGVEGVNADGAVWDILGARAASSSSNYVQIYSTRNTSITLQYLTLRYTKSS